MATLSRELLDETVRRVAEALDPEEIYLFGSHAYGTPDQDSDVDLMVVVPDTTVPTHKRAIPAYQALRGLLVPTDILVVTRPEFEKRARWFSSIERVVAEKGMRVYENRSRGGSGVA
jgi:predicted nucleotidyltransferase